MNPQDLISEAANLINEISKTLNADVLLYSGDIEEAHGKTLTMLCEKYVRHPNVFLILVTRGGDPNTAYRISRCLQRKYKKLIAYIPGLCKSAGTLVVLGAHEIVVDDRGELGPLDIQLSKRDELWEKSSGLTVMEALDSLKQKSFSMFEDYLIDLKVHTGGQITLKTATQIASTLTAQLFGPIYGQIDPLTIGENGRAMKVSEHYGKILNEKGRNLQDDALGLLIAGYPAHDIVIDREEAGKLFKNVRAPSQQEGKLAQVLQEIMPMPTREKPVISFLSDDDKKETEKSHEPQGDQGHTEGKREATETPPGDTGKTPPPQDGYPSSAQLGVLRGLAH